MNNAQKKPEKYGRPCGGGHAVERGVLRYVSPSQLKTFDPECGG